MRCPECGGKTTVYNTMKMKTATYRRRKCLSCGNNFNTKEEVTSDAFCRESRTVNGHYVKEV